MTPRKRIIFLASEKGGVGKSTTAANIVTWALSHGASVVAIDPDDANHTLGRVLTIKEGEEWLGDGDARPVPVRPDGLGLVVPVNVDAADSLDVVYQALAAPETNLVVVDGVGSQHRRTVMKWVHEVNFFEVAAEVPADITFVLVVEEDADVYSQSLRLMQDVGNKVEWVIVQNEKQHVKWPLWEDCRARKVADELNAKVVKLPQMQPHLARGLQDLNVCLGAAEPAMVNVLDKQRARTLWRAVSAELDKAADYLLPAGGVPEAGTEAVSASAEPAPAAKKKRN